MKNFLIETNNIKKSSVIWNMIAYTSNSFQSMLLLLILSRDKNFVDSAIFSIAFTAASMLLYVGKFAVRNYQVSDVNNEYTYGDYLKSRAITVVIMVVSSIVYLLYCAMFKSYSIYKVVCCVLIILVRLIEAIEDVFHGHLQKNYRLDVASKIWGLRTIAYVVSFIVAYYISKSLLVAATIGLVVTTTMFFFLNACVYDLFERDTVSKDGKAWSILKNCFPLALSTFITVYIGNSPKYTVDAVLSSEDQVTFNVIFMPVFVIALLGNYIYNPMINKLSELWNNKEINTFKKSVFKQICIVLLCTMIVILGGEIIGIRILELLYSVPLMNFKVDFIYLMVAGGGLAIFNFLIIIATIIRKQKIVQYTSVVSALILIAFSKSILQSWGIRSLCLYYAIVVTVLVASTFLLCYNYLKKGNLQNDSI